MKKIIVLVVLALTIFSCTMNNDVVSVLSTENLESLIVKVGPETDTLIVTPKGAKIKISKGTFDAQNELEIKEAYTIKDMLLAGLVTETDSTLLQSGGMVYINTLNGEPLKLNKSIGIIIPSEYVEENMKLFKGDFSGNNMKWKSPVPIDTVPKLANIFSGKNSFAKCASCHQVFKDATGPFLVGIEKRGPWSDKNKLLDFINNPSKFMATDAYSQDLKNKFGSVMQAFPDFKMSDLDNLLEFLKNEERKAIVNGTFVEYSPPLVVTADSSSDFQSVIESEVRDSAETFNNSLYSFTDFISVDDAYEFQIETFGWYNIDAEMPGQPGTVACKLEVNLEGAVIEGMSVYLFVPGRKNLSVGQNEGADRFSFNKYNNAIPLVLNDKAFVLAFGNNGDKFYYGVTGFSVKKEQLIDIRLKSSTKEQFLQVIKEEKLEGLNMKVLKQ